MEVELKKIMPGDTAGDVANTIYNNDNSLLLEISTKASSINVDGNKVVYAPDGKVPVPDMATYAKREDIFTATGGSGWVDVPLVWQDGYYVDLNGNILGGGTNQLYKLSEPIAVKSGEKYKAILQAGNLLAVSGWNNGMFNNSIAIVGTDTNNSVEYSFTIPTGVTHIRQTCRVEFVTPKLLKLGGGIVGINRIDMLEKEVGRITNGSAVIAFNNDFTGNNIITGNGTILGGGTFQYPVNIATEDLDFFAKVNVKSNGSEFGLCRRDTTQGTALFVRTSTVEIRKMNTTTGAVIYTYDLPFSIEVGKDYVVRMFKRNKDVLFSVVSETDAFTGFAERLDSKDFGRNWGYPAVFCLTGQIEVKDAELRNSNFESPLVFCVGDSFIEGWGVVNNLNKRYIALMQTITGGNVEISGRGGETTTSLLTRFDAELSKSNSDYILLAIGTNDSNINTYKANMATLIGKVKATGRIPVLVTVTPRSGYPIAEMNTYVRSSGELYIDMNKAVNNGTETVWNPLFVNFDGVHPNIAGNEAMFKRILFDLPQLFDTRKIYEMSLDV